MKRIANAGRAGGLFLTPALIIHKDKDGTWINVFWLFWGVNLKVWK